MMDFDEVKSILNTLNNRRQELGKLLELENKTIERGSYFVEIEHVQLEFSKSEVYQILEGKKKSLENRIRELAKNYRRLKNDIHI